MSLGYWINEKDAETAERWLEGAEQQKGSWWTDWIEWLSSHSGEQVLTPVVGCAMHLPITPAPGLYVLEK
jgi:polyhydroxyalkanoate synthase